MCLDIYDLNVIFSCVFLQRASRFETRDIIVQIEALGFGHHISAIPITLGHKDKPDATRTMRQLAKWLIFTEQYELLGYDISKSYCVVPIRWKFVRLG